LSLVTSNHINSAVQIHPEHSTTVASAAAAAAAAAAGLSQLRAVQLSIDGGFNAEHAAFHWGVGVGQQGAGSSSSSLAAIGEQSVS
jgi:hypothetical protein